MRMPPPEALRDEEPPDDLLLVVRGGANSLSDAVLDRSTSVCWEKYEFFGVSVFAAPEDDLVALSEANLAIRRRRQVRTHVAALFVRQVSRCQRRSPILATTPSCCLIPRAVRVAAVVFFGARGQSRVRSRTLTTTMVSVTEPTVELWVDDHQEYEPGVVHGHLRHARIALDPQAGDSLVVGDDEAPPVLAEVLRREPSGELLLPLLPGRPEGHPEFRARRAPTAV